LSLAVIWLSSAVWRRTHWSLALLFVYTLINALWAFAWRENQFERFSRVVVLAFERSAAYSAFAFLLFTALCLLASRKQFLYLAHSLGVLCIVNSVAIIVQYCVTDTPARLVNGIMGASSMSACIVAMTYPFLCFKPERSEVAWLLKFKKDWLFLLCMVFYIVTPVIAIFITKSSMAVGILAVVLFTYFCVEYKKPKIGLAICGVIAGISYAFDPLVFDQLHSGVRVIVWKMVAEWWVVQDLKTIILGTGAGAGEIHITNIQYLNGHRETGGWFLWLHSDWLQMIFEYGILGLAVYLNAFFFAVKTAWKNVYLLPALLGVAACALGNYPVRIAPDAFITLAIVVMCFRLTRDDTIA